MTDPRKNRLVRVTTWLSALVGRTPRKAEEELCVQSNPELRQGEVLPPWFMYPGIEAGRMFWKEAGDHYRTEVWEPYFNGLSPNAQEEYKTYWRMPKDWCTWYELLNDPDFKNADDQSAT